MGIGTGVSRAAAVLIALVAWIGMAVQFNASFEQQTSVGVTLWIMFRYFTIIANFLAALLFTRIAVRRDRLGSASLLGGVTLAMLLVGVIYWLLLRGMIELSGGAKLADLLLHSVTPILVPLYWLFFAPKGSLRASDPWLWFILPVAYFVYALIRGAMEGIYAYPFVDVARNGWMQTAKTAALMALGFLAAGYVLVWLDHQMVQPSKEESPRS